MKQNQLLHNIPGFKAAQFKVTGLGTFTCHKLAKIGYRLERNVEFLP